MAQTHLMQRLKVASSTLLGLGLLGGALGTVVGRAVPASAYVIDKKGQSVALSSLADFDKCANEIGNLDACINGLKDYVKKHPKEGFDAGKHVRLQMTHWAALDFFGPALSKTKTPERCADPDVSMAVVSGLSLPAEYPALAVARKLASELCWEQLQPALLKALDEPGGYLNGNVCPLLAEKKVDAPKCKVEPAKPKVVPPSVASQLKGIDWKTLTVDPDSARALRGSNGEELYVARSKAPKGVTLLKFKNIQGPWNEQVLLAIERPGGIGTDYVLALGASEFVALTERGGQFEGYIKGKPDSVGLYPVRPTKEVTKVPTNAEIANELSAKKASK